MLGRLQEIDQQPFHHIYVVGAKQNLEYKEVRWILVQGRVLQIHATKMLADFLHDVEQQT